MNSIVVRKCIDGIDIILVTEDEEVTAHLTTEMAKALVWKIEELLKQKERLH